MAVDIISQITMTMISHFNQPITLCTVGRGLSRPRQSFVDELESLDLNEQAELVQKYANVNCQSCGGYGGIVHTDTIDQGYYTLENDYLEVCECVQKNPLLNPHAKLQKRP